MLLESSTTLFLATFATFGKFGKFGKFAVFSSPPASRHDTQYQSANWAVSTTRRGMETISHGSWITRG